MTGPGGEAAAREPLDEYGPELNTLERRARRFLDGHTATRADPPPLGDRDRRRLRRVRRRTVLLAALSGTVSGLAIGAGEVWLRLRVIGDAERGLLEDPWLWAGFYLAVGVLTLLEILFLYALSLRAIARIHEAADAPAEPEAVRALVEVGLVRGALEMPNPRRRVHGIDPYAHVSRRKLLVWNLLYRAKVGATSLALRVLLRRILARAFLRGFVPLLAAPLYAAWNAFVLWRVMEEARLRALGPFAVRQVAKRAKRGGEGEAWHQALWRGAAETVRRAGDAHPNLVLLLSALRQGREADPPWRGARAELAELDPGERRRLIGVLAPASVLAGPPASAQLALLAEMHEAAGTRFDPRALAALRRRLFDGLPLDEDDEPS